MASQQPEGVCFVYCFLIGNKIRNHFGLSAFLVSLSKWLNDWCASGSQLKHAVPGVLIH